MLGIEHMIYMKCLLCDQGFEGGGQAELDNLFIHYRSVHYHDMNEHLARCIVELQNKQDKLEMAVDELRHRTSTKLNK